MVLVLLFGADLLSYLPIGLFAAVVFFLGFDLLLTAYYDHGLMMPRVELAIVVAMPVIALVFGFMVAVGFGVAVAALLFVIAYSRVNSTQISTTTTINTAIDGNKSAITNGSNTKSNSIAFKFSGNDTGVGISNFECSIDNSNFTTMYQSHPIHFCQLR